MAIDPQADPPESGWTVSDYIEMEDDGERYELYEGELVVTPSPSFEHQRVLSDLAWQLTSHVRKNGLGEVVQAPCDVMFGDKTVVQPDLLFVAGDRLDEVRQGHALGGPPDLVVEVLSDSTARRDRTRKRDIYAQNGVPWLLIVDPDERTVESFELDDGSYRLDAAAGGDESLPVGRFTDFELELGAIWSDDTR